MSKYMRTINIRKDLIPYKFDIRIGGETFTFHINYNNEADMFTIDLYKNDDPIALGEPLVFGKPLFSSFVDERKPRRLIMPGTIKELEEGEEYPVNWKNFMNNVFLWIMLSESDL